MANKTDAAWKKLDEGSYIIRKLTGEFFTGVKGKYFSKKKVEAKKYSFDSVHGVLKALRNKNQKVIFEVV